MNHESISKTTSNPLNVVSKISYKGVDVVVLEDVYEPAEDTFLLAECAVSEFEKTAADSRISSSFSSASSAFSLEIGAGSGFASAFLQSAFPNLNAAAVDINPNAVLCSEMNGVRVFESDMFQIFKASESVSFDSNVLKPQRFDLILFNPPYLPTADDEKIDSMLNYAFDGGISGRDSIDRFLAEVGAYLSENGFFLLLISSITGLEEVKDEMMKNGFSAEIIGKKKCSFEELMVLKGKPL